MINLSSKPSPGEAKKVFLAKGSHFNQILSPSDKTIKEFLLKEITEQEAMLRQNTDGLNLSQAKSQNNLLFISVQNNNFPLASLLLRYKADPNVQNKFKETPGHKAVEIKNHKMINGLLENHANPNIKQETGETPMHLAAWNGEYKVIKLLLLFEADPIILSNDGYLPIDYASEREHQKCIDVLGNATTKSQVNLNKSSKSEINTNPTKIKGNNLNVNILSNKMENNVCGKKQNSINNKFIPGVNNQKQLIFKEKHISLNQSTDKNKPRSTVNGMDLTTCTINNNKLNISLMPNTDENNMISKIINEPIMLKNSNVSTCSLNPNKTNYYHPFPPFRTYTIHNPSQNNSSFLDKTASMQEQYAIVDINNNHSIENKSDRNTNNNTLIKLRGDLESFIYFNKEYPDHAEQSHNDINTNKVIQRKMQLFTIPFRDEVAAQNIIHSNKNDIISGVDGLRNSTTGCDGYTSNNTYCKKLSKKQTLINECEQMNCDSFKNNLFPSFGTQLFDKTIKENNTDDKEITDYLYNIHMENYTSLFIKEGFASINSLLTIMKSHHFGCDGDLQKMGIALAGHRARILIKLKLDSSTFGYPINLSTDLEDSIFHLTTKTVFDYKSDRHLIDLYTLLEDINGNELFIYFFNNGYHSREGVMMQMISDAPINEGMLELEFKIRKYGDRRIGLNKGIEESKEFLKVYFKKEDDGKVEKRCEGVNCNNKGKMNCECCII